MTNPGASFVGFMPLECDSELRAGGPQRPRSANLEQIIYVSRPRQETYICICHVSTICRDQRETMSASAPTLNFYHVYAQDLPDAQRAKHMEAHLLQNTPLIQSGVISE